MTFKFGEPVWFDHAEAEDPKSLYRRAYHNVGNFLEYKTPNLIENQGRIWFQHGVYSADGLKPADLTFPSQEGSTSADIVKWLHGKGIAKIRYSFYFDNDEASLGYAKCFDKDGNEVDAPWPCEDSDLEDIANDHYEDYGVFDLNTETHKQVQVGDAWQSEPEYGEELF